MPVGGEVGFQSPTAGGGELQPPEAFGHIRRWRAEFVGRRHDGAVQNQASLGQRFDQPKRERAAGEYFVVRLSRCGFLRGGEAQFFFRQLTVRVPQARRTAFGDDLEAVVPGALAEGAERAEGFLEKFDGGAGRVGEAIEFHFKKRSMNCR